MDLLQIVTPLGLNFLERSSKPNLGVSNQQSFRGLRNAQGRISWNDCGMGGWVGGRWGRGLHSLHKFENYFPHPDALVSIFGIYAKFPAQRWGRELRGIPLGRVPDPFDFSPIFEKSVVDLFFVELSSWSFQNFDFVKPCPCHSL